MNSPQRILFGDKFWLSAWYALLCTTDKKIVFTFVTPLAIALTLMARRKISPSAAGKTTKMQCNFNHIFLIDHNAVGFAQLFFKTLWKYSN
jgi:hypothetical protein